MLKRPIVGRGFPLQRERLVLHRPMVWQMLEQLQSVQEGKSHHPLQASRTEAQDARRELDLFRSGDLGAVAVEGICPIEAGTGYQSSARCVLGWLVQGEYLAYSPEEEN